MTLKITNQSTFNDSADFWFYDIGVNLIPADTQEKTTYEKWSQWQDRSIPDNIFEQWKKENKFQKGLAVILGKVWRGVNKDKYLIGIDCDNKKAIEEICTRKDKVITLSDLARWTIVEQHKDQPDKAHIYILSTKPFKKKSSDKVSKEIAEKLDKNDIPAIEIKGSGEHGILFCWPSFHKNGSPYELIGTKTPAICDDFEGHLDQIFQKYGISYLDNTRAAIANGKGRSDLIPTTELFKPDFVIYEGHNRHEGLLRASESLIQRNKKYTDINTIKELVHKWNHQHCSPPLNNKEVERQWNAAWRFTSENSKNDQHYNFNTRQKQQQEDDKQKETGFETLIKLIGENINVLFIDQFGVLYASVKIDNHFETISLESKRFELYFRRLLFFKNKKNISKETINNVIEHLKAEAEFNGITRHLELRVAKAEDFTWYYDLTNEDCYAVKITPEGWSIDKEPPLIFKRYRNQQPQVYPVEIPDNLTVDSTDDPFRDFIGLTNIRKDDKDTQLMIRVYTTALLIPDIPKPILMPHGEQGSAKSTLMELIKILVDPCSIKTLTFPRNIEELIQQFSHNYVSFYDNVSNMPVWISDLLCRAVTGNGFSKRMLWSIDDDMIYNFRRCTGFNGINMTATKADLLDRGIPIPLERIPKGQRKKIIEIWEAFEKIKPRLLGYIFSILSKVLKMKHGGGVTLPNGLNRMADFEEYGEMISRCMGYPDNEFSRVYQEIVNIQVDEAIEANPYAIALKTFIENWEHEQGTTEWQGTATELHDKIELTAINQLRMNPEKIRSWPKSASTASKRLNEIRTVLREKGIDITRDRDSKGTRIIKICKVPSEPSRRQGHEFHA